MRRPRTISSSGIERGGGQEAIVAQGSLGYTPAPGEAPQYMP